MLQLCLYSELVSSVQGLTPEYPYVVAPWSDYEPQIFRMDDYAAYYRQVRDGRARAVEDHGGKEIYPDPKPHCDICRWQHRCDQRRRADDHLSLVAGISKIQIDELKRQGVETTADLAVMPLPLGWKAARGATYSYERIREQARIQVEGRTTSATVYELLPVVPGFGLQACRHPPRAISSSTWKAIPLLWVHARDEAVRRKHGAR